MSPATTCTSVFAVMGSSSTRVLSVFTTKADFLSRGCWLITLRGCRSLTLFLLVGSGRIFMRSLLGVGIMPRFRRTTCWSSRGLLLRRRVVRFVWVLVRGWMRLRGGLVLVLARIWGGSAVSVV